MSNYSCTIRELEVADLPAVVRVLAEGFPRVSDRHWDRCLKIIKDRDYPRGTPQFGYGIEDSGLQGVVLTLGSLHGVAESSQTIINISSWTVRPSHRGIAAKALFDHASSFEGVTYSDLSAAAHTIRTITKLGFRESTAGQVLGLGLRRAPETASILTVKEAAMGLAADKLEMLRYHESYGCICFCVELRDRLAPLIFLPRKIKGLIPLAQLIYCERSSDLQEHARAIYYRLLSLGFPGMLVDGSGPIPGLAGRYFPGKAARYYKGPFPDYAVDHTYSEMIYIGF